MKKFFLVFKASLLALIMKSGASRKNSKVSTAIILVISALFIALALGSTFFIMASELSGTDLLAVVPVAAFAVSTALSFITAVSTAHGSVFKIRDGELLFSLPVGHVTILSAKICVIYVNELIYSSAVLIPAGIAYFHYAGWSLVPVAAFLIALIASPLIPMAFGLLVSFAAALITRKMRYKNAVGTVLFLVVFSAYIIFISNSNYIGYIIENAGSVLRVITGFYFPASLFCEAVQGSVLKALLLLAAGAVPIILMIFAFASRYSSLTESMNTVADSPRRHNRSKQDGASSPLASCFKKEAAQFFSTFIYFINVLVGPLMSLLYYFMIFRRSTPDIDESGKAIIFYISIFFHIMLITMTPASASAISLEGNRLWIYRSLPVESAVVFKAKILLSFGVQAAFVVLNTFIMGYISGFGFEGAITYLIMLLPASLLASTLALLINIWKPKLEYSTPAAVVKQSLAVFLSMVSSFVITAVSALVFFAGKSVTGGFIPSAVIVAAVLSIITFAFIRVLKDWGAKRFESLIG